MKRFVIIAGETSGDTYGAQLINSLKLKFNEPIEFWGIGGDKMVSAGLNQLESINKISVVGFSEAFKNIFSISKLLNRITSFIVEINPVDIILIDFPGFNLNLAKKIKQSSHRVHITYFVSPQLWAWNEGRIKSIKKNIDNMLVIFPFEKDYYHKRDVSVKYVGHPFLDEWIPGNSEALKEDLGFEKMKKIIGIFPGSRKEEIEKHLPIYLEAIPLIKNYHPNIDFAIGLAPSFDKKKIQKKFNTGNLKIVSGDPLKLLECTYVNMVTSGTISLQSTFMNVPCVVGYKLSSLSWYISRLVIKIDYISMTNIIADEIIFPELIQKKLTPKNLADEIKRFIDNKKYYNKVKQDMLNIKNIFSEKQNAINNVAIFIKDTINEKI